MHAAIFPRLNTTRWNGCCSASWPIGRLSGDSWTAAADDQACSELLRDIPRLHTQITEHLVTSFSAHTNHAWTLEQALKGLNASAAVRGPEQVLGDLGYAIRSLVFKDVSRIKNPTVHAIRFSRQLKQQIHALLRPGDILLSYAAGYISDVFIPGNF